ncbi:cytochrome P450 [Mesorhizobium australicum]|uniref:Dyp-type peroxidase family n=1 Tax=Mesorhizobium australicum TaxID=536018 RepID=A0A1X7PV02_9HYPH|nr:cytochrome P450 [Mesorhizobium australicum]SMH56089.1 Dyp-type peroxidase family [Mesorhizobium australicum]
MITTKYFDGVIKAQAEQGPVSDMPPFDLGRLRSKGGIGEWVKGLIFEDPRWWLKIVRRWWPTVRIGKFVLVTRDADVREILERESEFITPYGLEMTEMAGGSNFILGMQDGPDYRKLKKPLLSAFPPAEVEARVRPIAARHAREIMDRASPGFDAIAGLMKIVPVKICREYFGMIVDDEDEFADWSIALSSIFFSDPTANKATRELAVVAADRMIKAVDRSIAAVREGSALPDTPLSRMVAMIDQGVLKLEEVHSVMLGMISGFAPTNLLAGGNCLDVILSKPEAQTAVRLAVGAGDTKALDKAVLEAMRFKPIWIGPWRYASADLRIAEGTPREKVIPHKSTVMPATLSAMFDPDAVERPDEFDPERPKKTYMVYGHGIHVCIGIEVARVQIGECLRAIFAKKGVRRMPGRAGKMTRIGAFPEHLRIDFEREDLDRIAPQSLVTVALPTKPGVSLGEVRDSVDKLGNPAGDEMRAALDAAGIIHFASIAVADTGKADPATGKPLGMVVLEFSGDGDSRQVIAALAHHASPIVRPILERACDIPAGGDLEELFAKKSIDISPSFGSTAGLVFAGTPGHSVQRIRAEAKLAAFAERIAETPHPGDARGAAGVLAEVREKLKADGGYDWAFRSTESLLERPPGNIRRAIQATLGSFGFTAVLVALIAACAWITYWYVFGPAPGIIRNLLVGGTSLVLALIGLAFVIGILLFLARFALDRLERTDKRGVESIPLDDLEKIQKREDHSAQNHLTAISVMKPGTLRRLALRLAFYLISISAQKVFRPGYLADINTIHFARWVLLPGTDRLMFFSNYGGSWESYLEDFITKAAAGLTGVWSNTVGFPRAKDLFGDGARDGDRFKRWARRQQVPTLFWYSAYPEVNTQRIRINSRIRRGICRATDGEARDWLSLFGSRPRPRISQDLVEAAAKPEAPQPPEPLESGEIQSIFFNAFGALDYGHLTAFEVPGGLGRDGRRTWLEFLTAQTSFGDPIPRDRAMTIAFGPRGLRRLGLDGGADEEALKRFPNAFLQGMGHPERSRILDDIGESQPGKWRWGSPEKPVDMIVLCYAKDPSLLAKKVAEVKKRAKAAGLSPGFDLPLETKRQAPLETKRYNRAAAASHERAETVRRNGRAIEHFGFADGISQPAVRGTARAHGGAPEANVVAAGEFLFGYRDEHGFYPVSPAVKAHHDPSGILSSLRFRRGADGTTDALHDFGRNGSFIVVRQFEQHVDAFDDYCVFAAKTKAKEHDDPSITPEWIAAKMMGRWKDGSSLVRNPEGRPDRPVDNAFSYGAEDPQGLRCPFGAHIRRSNPRDSLGDDHATQISIGKRHRILRVGRTYEVPGAKKGETEKGLLFMCLNADIERQYEFMQQTWVSARSFHGLAGEKDPAIGANEGKGRFSIPKWEGNVVLREMPSFVTTRGGGYFFMPSRAALRFMISRL